jgi:hypothetical protein
VGFVDMKVNFLLFNPCVAGFIDEIKEGKLIKDIKDRIRIGFTQKDETIYIEVKTEISSLGELIRQIRHYKEYLPGLYYVLCPDDTHMDTLQDQNIGFIKYITK